MANNKRGTNEAFVNSQGRLKGNSSEAARIGALGGKKSKLNYDKKKLLKDLLLEAMELNNEDGENNAVAMSMAMIKRAQEGSEKAYEIVRDTIGQKPSENVSMQVELPEFINDLKD